MQIISGGQAGVDRAALDAALSEKVSIAGWCPEGRVAEDGCIPDCYPLIEIKHGKAIDRTRKNVNASNGTALIYFGLMTGGTLQTLCYCIYRRKPFVLIDANKLGLHAGAEKVLAFLNQYSISILNVAGPRASDHPQAYTYTFEMIRLLCKQMKCKGK